MVRVLPAFHERARELGLLVFIGLAIVLSFPYFERTRNANELPRLLQSMAIVDAGELAIDGPAARGIDPGPDVARSRHDGRLYPNKPPGTSAVAASGYVVARALSSPTDPLTLRRFTLWARIVTGALPTLLLCWFLVRRLTSVHGRAAAMGAVVLYVLGTPAQAYAHLAYGHQLTAALLVVGIGLVVRAMVEDDGSGRSGVRALVGGLLAGAAVTVEYAAVFAAVPLGIGLLVRAQRIRPATLAGLATAGAIASVAMLAAYHHAVYGSVLETGYHHVTNPVFADKHGEGLLGLAWPRYDAFFTHVLAADTGLLWWVPAMPLALYGLARLAMHGEAGPRFEARIHLGLWVVYLLVLTSLSFEGGWRVGPRYLVLILPTLALGWSEVLSQARTEARWIFAISTLGTYAIVVNTLAANLWPHFDPTNIHNAVAEVLLPLWDLDLAPYSIAGAGWGNAAMHAVVVGIVVCALLVLSRIVELRAANIVAFVAGTALGVGLVSATRAWPPHPMGERNLAYIVRIWEPPPGTGSPGPSIRLPILETTARPSGADGRRRASP